MLLKEEAIREIEEKIGYHFELKSLLEQAFIRRSYINELPYNERDTVEDNEVLEFIGDKVLDYIVVKTMAKMKGAVDLEFYDYRPVNGARSGMYSSSLSEGKLTDVKTSMVEKKALAKAMSLLGLQKYLIMGQGDINSNINETDSVKEDLFEAILGAVAIDCEWNMEVLEKVLFSMYDIEDAIKNAYVNPKVDAQWDEVFPKAEYNIHYYIFGARDRVLYPSKGRNRIEWYDLHKAQITICDKSDKILGCYYGVAGERDAAITKAKTFAINDYKEEKKENQGNPILALLEGLTLENSTNVMNELCQKGLIEKEEENAISGKDEQGNPLWSGEIKILGYGVCLAHDFNSKKELRKATIYRALSEVKKIVKGKHELFPLIYEVPIKKRGEVEGRVVGIYKNKIENCSDLIELKLESGKVKRFVYDERFVVEGDDRLSNLMRSYYKEKGKDGVSKNITWYKDESLESEYKKQLLKLVGAKVWDIYLGKGVIVGGLGEDIIIEMENESRFARHMFSRLVVCENMAIEKDEYRAIFGKMIAPSIKKEKWYTGDYDFSVCAFPGTTKDVWMQIKEKEGYVYVDGVWRAPRPIVEDYFDDWDEDDEEAYEDNHWGYYLHDDGEWHYRDLDNGEI